MYVIKRTDTFFERDGTSWDLHEYRTANYDLASDALELLNRWAEWTVDEWLTRDENYEEILTPEPYTRKYRHENFLGRKEVQFQVCQIEPIN